jgi:hypothetical protein
MLVQYDNQRDKLPNIIRYIFFCDVTDQLEPRPPRFEVSRLHTITHAHTHIYPVGLLWTNDQPIAEAATYVNTQHTQETNILSLLRIRTRDPSNQAASDLLLGPHGHRGPLVYIYVTK